MTEETKENKEKSTITKIIDSISNMKNRLEQFELVYGLNIDNNICIRLCHEFFKSSMNKSIKRMQELFEEIESEL